MTDQTVMKQKDLGSLIVCTLFVVLGTTIIIDTNSYSDLDSKVFPRACAIVMIVFSIFAIIRDFFKQTASEGFGDGTWWRRIVLVVTMLIACLAMPYLTFLPAGGIAFVGGLIAAMHDQWSKRALILYWGSGLVITVAFFVIFKYALNVPLP